MMSSSMPEDLMIGILSRLPVKSLLRFESVSKSFCTIITSRNFRYEHLNNNIAAAGCLWAQFDLPNVDEFASCWNVCFPDGTLADPLHHHFDIPNIDNILHGPCNGIYLASFFHCHYALWNPATKEYRELPNPGFPWYCYQESCGFGLDPITKDYKVVILQQIEHENLDLVGKIHTLGTDHWKDLTLDRVPVRYLYNSTSHTYLDGGYYFHCRNSTALSFDMATDAIEVIPPPNELEPIYDTYTVSECLAVFQDTIALFYIELDENDLGVWMLTEKSWIKHFTVGLQPNVKIVVGCWNDEFLLKADDDGWLLYNPTTQEIRNVGFQAPLGCRGIHAYKESLISIEEEYEYKRQRDLHA